VSSELFDLAEQFVELQRVLAKKAALQKESIGWTRAVANFAQPVDALIGVNPDDGARARPWLDDRRNAKIDDFQRRGTGVDVDSLVGFHAVAHQQAAPQYEGGSLHDIAAIVSVVVSHIDLSFPKCSRLQYSARSPKCSWQSPRPKDCKLARKGGV